MYGLHLREELEESTARELDALISKLKAFMLHEHNEDGSHNFGLPTGGHSGESITGVTPINLDSQSFINNLNPGLLQAIQTMINAGSLMPWRMIRKVADDNFVGTTIRDDNELFFVVPANKTAFFRTWISTFS